ncbi:MAG: chloramphenicol acetyltransferase [Anaerolineales bacterium]|nr:chloramphenicol acetyltransferase [Anaerolineales bacterium]
MRTINLENWPRREHYLFFKEFESPHFSLCVEMDLTEFLPAIKEMNVSFTAAIMYLVARAANNIPEFKQRVREGSPIEHEIVHPSATILTKDDLFTFCTVEYKANFKEFVRITEEEISRVKTAPSLDEKFLDDNMLFMTSIPWVSFTSFMHPIKLNPPDSVPRFAWGKYFNEGEKTKMPLSVQGHHAVMDGIHAGRFYQEVQDILSAPEKVLDA